MTQSKFQLRPYQVDLNNETKRALSEHKRIIVQAMTGAGKTRCFANIVKGAYLKGSRVLIVSHRIEVVKQNLQACIDEGIPAKLISAQTKKIPAELVTSAMAQTLLRRVEKPEWDAFVKSVDILIIDEAHDSTANFIFDHISPKCYVIGYSATPIRYGKQRQLGMDYNHIVTGPSADFLISQGYLCRCRLHSLDAPKMDDVEFDYGRGDYSLSQMAKKFQSKPRYVGTVNNWERIAKGTKTIVFCCSSTQAIEITKEFCNRGYRAKYCLSGSFDEDDDYSGERKQIMKDFSDGEFDILVNVGIGVAGLDIPSIKTCILCYATISLTKYLQSLGRAARPHPSKNGEFICLDMGANYEKLGHYEQERKWFLWHNTGKSGGPVPVKECPEAKGGCGRLIPIQSQDCPFCHFHFLTSQEVYEVELHEIVATKTGKETIEQYVARKKLQGWKNDWILRDICQKNPDNQKEVFMRAIEVLRTQHGSQIKPTYWYFFKNNKLNKRKK